MTRFVRGTVMPKIGMTRFVRGMVMPKMVVSLVVRLSVHASVGADVD